MRRDNRLSAKYTRIKRLIGYELFHINHLASGFKITPRPIQSVIPEPYLSLICIAILRY